MDIHGVSLDQFAQILPPLRNTPCRCGLSLRETNIIGLEISENHEGYP